MLEMSVDKCAKLVFWKQLSVHINQQKAESKRLMQFTKNAMQGIVELALDGRNTTFSLQG